MLFNGDYSIHFVGMYSTVIAHENDAATDENDGDAEDTSIRRTQQENTVKLQKHIQMSFSVTVLYEE